MVSELEEQHKKKTSPIPPPNKKRERESKNIKILESEIIYKIICLW